MSSTQLEKSFCSEKVCDLTPFLVMEVLEKAHRMEREGISVIHMEVGEPDFDTPNAVIEAAERAMRSGQTHYTHSMGLLELREAIAGHYHAQYGVEVSPERIVVTQGTSPAMMLTFAALLEDNDEVIISDPHYACYPNFIRFAGGKPVKVRVFEEDGFQYRPEVIAERIGPRTKGILINSPSNPTGNLLSEKRMRAIAELEPYVVSDEIYHGLVYGGDTEHSILEFTDRAFVFNGFSKLYAMTGWRLGYVIAPPEFVRGLQVMSQNFFISANAPTQWAGIAALQETAQDVERMRSVYDERRQFMIKRLKEIGFGITVEPTGAFYVLANATALNPEKAADSLALAYDILDKAHIGVTPGIDFGEGAQGYIRFSYANSLENLAEGMNRLEQYVNNHLRK
ncbi:pyridoxal phosphate-dependent aminotransferase [Desulfovibrio ferrophilus]|uniref:Aminotransferase n=1 Tax=Desulfovibrio ferrophilus TaxID=241368 RepID=A0A2Z6AUL9_9BACT|nr:pyridoxal phosphate-dependent aminotransferase [Desulfovibrio ferrophilus]BBD06910.1 aspartate aminotransferase [Desulfovibrio ferrophilus]